MPEPATVPDDDARRGRRVGRRRRTAARRGGAERAAALGEVALRDDLRLSRAPAATSSCCARPAAAAVVDSGPPEHATELAKLVRGDLGLLRRRAPVQHALASRTHGRQRGAALGRHGHRRARAHAPLDEHRVLRRLGRHARTRRARPPRCRRRTFYATDPQPIVRRDRRRGDRVRPSARGAHRRRHLRLVQGAQRARRGRRRDVRRISRHRLRDGRLDRRARRRHEEAARTSRTPTR